MTPEQIEREYNNRQAVPDHPQYFARWDRDSDYARKTLQGQLDLAYGPHPRQRIDYFPARNERGLLVFIHGGSGGRCTRTRTRGSRRRSWRRD